MEGLSETLVQKGFFQNIFWVIYFGQATFRLRQIVLPPFRSELERSQRREARKPGRQEGSRETWKPGRPVSQEVREDWEASGKQQDAKLLVRWRRAHSVQRAGVVLPCGFRGANTSASRVLQVRLSYCHGPSAMCEYYDTTACQYPLVVAAPWQVPRGRPASTSDGM